MMVGLEGEREEGAPYSVPWIGAYPLSQDSHKGVTAEPTDRLIKQHKTMNLDLLGCSPAMVLYY